MATARKDFRGRVLRKGEVQRASDKRYMYCYTDPFGRRKYIYANDLVTLREKETRLTKNQLDGLDTYVAGYATVNFVFDRYISLKTNLRETTRSNYLYMYDRHVRETFGERKIADIKYSDVLQFYNYLVVMKGLQTNTLESIHCLLHPTFQLAFRDDIIRKNPTDGVLAERMRAITSDKAVIRCIDRTSFLSLQSSPCRPPHCPVHRQLWPWRCLRFCHTTARR